MTKRTLVISVIALTTVLTGGWALAQSAGSHRFGPAFMHGEGPDGVGPGMMMGIGHGMMQGMGMGPGMTHGRPGLGLADPAQLETLKSELGITAAQEQAWSKYAKAVQDASAAMNAAREGIDPAALSKMNPSDRFAFVTKMRERAQEQFGAIKATANELLTTLDASQQAKARSILPGLAFGPGSMRGAFAGDQQR